MGEGTIPGLNFPSSRKGTQKDPILPFQGSPRRTSGLLASPPMDPCGLQGPCVVPRGPSRGAAPWQLRGLQAAGPRQTRLLTEPRYPDLGGVELSARWVSGASALRGPVSGSKSAHLGWPLQREHLVGVCTRLISIPSTTSRQDSLALRKRDQARKVKGTPKVTHRGGGGRVGGRLGAQVRFRPRILFGAQEFAKCFSQTLSSSVLLPLGPQPIQTPPRAALSSTVATTHSELLNVAGPSSDVL